MESVNPTGYRARDAYGLDFAINTLARMARYGAEVSTTDRSLRFAELSEVGQTEASWRIVVTRGGVFDLGRKLILAN